MIRSEQYPLKSLMLTYEINYFIHSIIRDEKLVHTMEALLDQSNTVPTILDDLISEFKRFLAKENDEIFSVSQLKYMTYLEEFKAHLDDIPDIKDRKISEINLALIRLYEIPKKRNNLFSALLVYFYIRNRTKLKGKALFKIIYLYLLIIAYRNRLSVGMRENMIRLDKKRFFSITDRIKPWIIRLRRRYDLLFSILRHVGEFGLIALIGLISWQYAPLEEFLKADILSANNVNHVAIGKVAFDSIFLGRVTDGALATVWQFGLENILIIALLALVFQSLRTGLTNVFVNSLLAKLFDFLGSIVRMLSRALFFLYHYIIYKLSTRFLLGSVDLVIGRGIQPGVFLLVVFSIAYFGIYFSIISFYLFAGVYLTTWDVAWWQIGGGALILSSLLIYLNVRADLESFKKFLLEIEETFKSVISSHENEAKV